MVGLFFMLRKNHVKELSMGFVVCFKFCFVFFFVWGVWFWGLGHILRVFYMAIMSFMGCFL